MAAGLHPPGGEVRLEAGDHVQDAGAEELPLPVEQPVDLLERRRARGPVEGQAQEHVRQAHTLAKLLLTDVREAVSQLREGGAIDLGAALRPLAENVPKLAIEMDIDDPLTVDDPERAHVLLRCAQEAITNAVRHAGASRLWLGAHRRGHEVVLKVRDDGNGSEQLVPGNGLRGLHERLRQHGGRLEVATRRGDGFQLTITLPVAASAAAGLPEGVAA